MPANPRPQMVHSGWTRDIIALAVSEGADAEPLWAASGLEPDALGDSVPEAAHLAVWEAIVRALDAPGFPIRVAERRNVDQYALLGLACKTSKTVRDALGHLIRFVWIWSDQYRCVLSAVPGGAQLVLDGPTGGLGRRCTNESALAQVVKGMRDVCGVPVRPTRVQFRHAAPRDIADHERFFGCDVHFGEAFDGLVLPTPTLDAQLQLADDALSTFLLGQLDALAAESRKSAAAEPLTDKVRAAISRLLPGGAPKLESVAAELAMTPRTLQRHLATVETTFARLTDETRLALARELLQNTDRSVAEISFVLGFSEPSAFHRAFKRWTGQTPSAFRGA